MLKPYDASGVSITASATSGNTPRTFTATGNQIYEKGTSTEAAALMAFIEQLRTAPRQEHPNADVRVEHFRITAREEHPKSESEPDAGTMIRLKFEADGTIRNLVY